MLVHHGVAIGVRHARKHLGWALDAAAATAGAPDRLLKSSRQYVLTATDPAVVQRRLIEAFGALGGESAALRQAARAPLNRSCPSRPPMQCSTCCRIRSSSSRPTARWSTPTS